MKCFIFDLDGVLTETSEQHYEAWKKLANEIGVDIDKEFNEQLKGISRMESLEKILEHCNVSSKYSDEDKIQLADKKNGYYIDSIKNLKPENAFTGVNDLLMTIKAEGFKIALGSASKNGPFILKALEIDHYFDYIVDPSKIRYGKPAPDTFLAAANHFGFNPSECIGVEDAVAGVEAIKSAGMYAIGIGNKELLSQANIVYNSVSNIRLSEILK